MASRENQGYLIAVICLVLLSLVLALTTFYGFSKMGEYSDNKIAAEKKAALSTKLAEANSARSEILKAMVGVPGSSVDQIQTLTDSFPRMTNDAQLDDTGKKQIRDIEADVRSLAESYDKIIKSSAIGQEGQEPTLIGVIDTLKQGLAKMNTEYKIKENQATLAQQDANVKIKDMEAVVQKAQEAQTLAEKDLNAEKESRRSDQAAHETAMNAATAELNKANQDNETARSLLNKALDETKSELTRIDDNNKNLNARVIKYETEIFDNADGQIIKVFLDSNLAIIDLGRVHGLSLNQSFSVYDRKETNYEKGKNKASIEITRISDNQAEARITQYNPNNPILPGDWILTPTWDPGNKVRFALAGHFDLDGDGFTDYDLVKKMIERNNGEVVCGHDANGEIYGKIDSSVRYLALGDSPSLGVLANPGVVAAIAKMKSEAVENTIQVIDKNKLFQKMGVRLSSKVEVLESGARSGAFQQRTPPTAQPGVDNPPADTADAADDGE